VKTSRVKVRYAKTHLSALIASVQRGDEGVIARGDTPAARLIAVEPPTERELGFVAYAISESFSDPLPEEELSAWDAGA